MTANNIDVFVVFRHVISLYPGKGVGKEGGEGGEVEVRKAKVDHCNETFFVSENSTNRRIKFLKSST